MSTIHGTQGFAKIVCVGLTMAALLLVLNTSADDEACRIPDKALAKEIHRLVPLGSTILEFYSPDSTTPPLPIQVQRLVVVPWFGRISLEVNGIKDVAMSRAYFREPDGNWRNLAARIGCNFKYEIERIAYSLPGERPALASGAPPDSLTHRAYRYSVKGVATAPLVVRQSPSTEAPILKILPAGTPAPLRETTGILHTKPARARVVFPHFHFRPGDEFWILGRAIRSYMIYFEGKPETLEFTDGCRPASYNCWFELESLPVESPWGRLEWPNGEWGWVQDPIAVFSGKNDVSSETIDNKKLEPALTSEHFGKQLDFVPRKVAALLVHPPRNLSELKGIAGPFEMNSEPAEHGSLEPSRYAMGQGEIGLIRAKAIWASRYQDPNLSSWSIEFSSGWRSSLEWLTKNNALTRVWRFRNLFFEPLQGDSFRVSWDANPANMDRPARSPEETRQLLDWLFRQLDGGFDPSVLEELFTRGMIYDAELRRFVLRGPTWTFEMPTIDARKIYMHFHEPVPALDIANRLGLTHPGIGWGSIGNFSVEILLESGTPTWYSKRLPLYELYFKVVTSESATRATRDLLRSAEGAEISSFEAIRSKTTP